jgi:hypothetical protein
MNCSKNKKVEVKIFRFQKKETKNRKKTENRQKTKKELRSRQ